MDGVFIINGHDYAPYLKYKSGLQWSRENTNGKDAGRDASERMHPGVTSHQRKLDVKMGPIPFEAAQQLEQDLQSHDEGVAVQYPDLYDGICTRLFYSTSVKSSIVRFAPDGLLLDDLTFSLVSVEEGTA